MVWPTWNKFLLTYLLTLAETLFSLRKSLYFEWVSRSLRKKTHNVKSKLKQHCYFKSRNFREQKLSRAEKNAKSFTKTFAFWRFGNIIRGKNFLRIAKNHILAWKNFCDSPDKEYFPAWFFFVCKFSLEIQN